MTQDFVTPPRPQSPLPSELEGVLRWSAVADQGTPGELLRGPRSWMQRALSLPGEGAFVAVRAATVDGWVQVWCPDPIRLPVTELAGSLSGPAAIALVSLAAEALRPLHDQGAHHGAISPDGVGFDAEGVLRIRPALHRPALAEPDGADGGRATDCLALGRLLRGLLGGSFEDDAAPLPPLPGLRSGRAPLLLAGLNRARPRLRIQPAAGVVQASAALLRAESADGEEELRALLRARGLGDGLRPATRPVWLTLPEPAPAPAPSAAPAPLLAAEPMPAPDAEEEDSDPGQQLRVAVMRVSRAVKSNPGAFSLDVIPPEPPLQEEDTDDPPTEPGDLEAVLLDDAQSIEASAQQALEDEPGPSIFDEEEDELPPEGLLVLSEDEDEDAEAPGVLVEEDDEAGSEPLQVGAAETEDAALTPLPPLDAEAPDTEVAEPELAEPEDVVALDADEAEVDTAPHGLAEDGEPAAEAEEAAPEEQQSAEAVGGDEAPGDLDEPADLSTPEDAPQEAEATEAEADLSSSAEEAPTPTESEPSLEQEFAAEGDLASEFSAEGDLASEFGEEGELAAAFEPDASEPEQAAEGPAEVEPAEAPPAESEEVLPDEPEVVDVSETVDSPFTADLSAQSWATEEIPADLAGASVASADDDALALEAEEAPEDDEVSEDEASVEASAAPDPVAPAVEAAPVQAAPVQAAPAQAAPAQAAPAQSAPAQAAPVQAAPRAPSAPSPQVAQEVAPPAPARPSDPPKPADVSPPAQAAPPLRPTGPQRSAPSPRRPEPEESVNILERQAARSLDDMFGGGQIGVRADSSREQELGLGKWGEEGRSLEEIARDMPDTPVRELDLGDEGEGRLSALLAALGLK